MKNVNEMRENERIISDIECSFASVTYDLYEDDEDCAIEFMNDTIKIVDRLIEDETLTGCGIASAFIEDVIDRLENEDLSANEMDSIFEELSLSLRNIKEYIIESV